MIGKLKINKWQQCLIFVVFLPLLIALDGYDIFTTVCRTIRRGISDSATLDCAKGVFSKPVPRKWRKEV